MLKNKRIDPRDPETIEWGELISETKTCVEFEELPGRYGIRTSQIFNDAEIDVFVGEYETPLDRITSGNPSETEFYASGGMAYIIVNAAHVGQAIRADYFPGGSVLTAEVLDSEDFKGPQGDTGPQGPAGPAGAPGDISDVENVGAGVGVFKDISAGTARFKSLVAGANIDFDTTDPDEVEIAVDAGSLVGGAINATSKSTLADNDRIAGANSEASNSVVYWLWQTIRDQLCPVGTYIQTARRTAPSGFLACDGSAVSRTTYAALYATLCPTLGTFTVTIASPAVVTLTGHGLQNGDRVRLFTTGALPTGLSVNTDYYVKSATTNTFRLAATPGGADINTSGSQSGTHTLQLFQHGAGDGSTTFNLPDHRGLVMVGAGTHGTMTRANGTAYNGGSVGASRNDQMQGHWHRTHENSGSGSDRALSGPGYINSTNNGTVLDNIVEQAVTDGTNGTPRTGDETRPAEIAVLVCIKF